MYPFCHRFTHLHNILFRVLEWSGERAPTFTEDAYRQKMSERRLLKGTCVHTQVLSVETIGEEGGKKLKYELRETSFLILSSSSADQVKTDGEKYFSTTTHFLLVPAYVLREKHENYLISPDSISFFPFSSSCSERPVFLTMLTGSEIWHN